MFMVRHSSNNLFLTSRRRGWIYHHQINYSTEGYCLGGKKKMFETILEMILHYLVFPMDTDSKQILGIGCDREGNCRYVTTISMPVFLVIYTYMYYMALQFLFSFLHVCMCMDSHPGEATPCESHYLICHIGDFLQLQLILAEPSGVLPFSVWVGVGDQIRLVPRLLFFQSGNALKKKKPG